MSLDYGFGTMTTTNFSDSKVQIHRFFLNVPVAVMYLSKPFYIFCVVVNNCNDARWMELLWATVFNSFKLALGCQPMDEAYPWFKSKLVPLYLHLFDILRFLVKKGNNWPLSFGVHCP